MAYCILIAGLPATGKTTFAAHLGRELSLPVISKDRLKELLYDSVGFRSHGEKVAISIASTDILYYFAEEMMRAGTPFILENNFENVSKPQLLGLLAQYRWHAVTVRFAGELGVVYQRFLQRNQAASRHKGHTVGDSYPLPGGDHLLHAPPTLEEFVAGIHARGLGEFTAGGPEIPVDATHFETLSYEEVVKQIREAVAMLPRKEPPLG